MKKATQPVKKRQFSLKTAQQQAFLQIFNLHAKDGKITKQDLKDIFQRIGYKISDNNFKDICQKAFGKSQKITFEQFMQTFKVKQSQYDLIDIKNAFKLIAGQSDEYIQVEELKRLFIKQQYDEQRVEEMLKLLQMYIEQNGQFNFKKFLSHLS